MMFIILLSLLLLLLFVRESDSLQFPTSSSRRAFFVRAAAGSLIAVTTTAAPCCGGCCEVANAAIDVSGLKVEQPTAVVIPPGRPPNQQPSGPLAGTRLGFQVGGGPRPEEEVRKIDEPRYAAVRKAQGLGPAFLEGVPTERPQSEKDIAETKWMR